MGRTHGRAAIPTTYGFKFVLFLDELVRAYDVINYTYRFVSVGKLGGAIGSQVELYPNGKVVEDNYLKYLGIEKAGFYTQVIPRDRLAYYLSSIIALSSVLDHIANEIRNLQRSEIEEVFEYFGEEQVGSSVMPHKRNPILSEKVCGLAKVLRGLVTGIFENINLEHERDLTNSSFERNVVPEIFLLVDEQLSTMIKVFDGLIINREKALENIKKQEPFIYSDLILQRAALNGADRQKVHKILRKFFLDSGIEDKDKIISLILKDRYLSRYLSREDLESVMDLEVYIDAAAQKVRDYLSNLSIGK
jgi:adenylosuccinate lyase